MFNSYFRLMAYTKVMRWLTAKVRMMNSYTTLIIGVWLIGAWMTHLFYCINEELWGFMIAGAIFAPIAVVHGTGIWLGIW